MGRSACHPGLHDARGRDLPHRLVDAMGVPTYVVDAGEGPPVVLIHGYGDSADGWRRVVPGLLDRHRVIAIDVPPFGRSGEPQAKKLLFACDACILAAPKLRSPAPSSLRRMGYSFEPADGRVEGDRKRRGQ